MCLQCKRKVRPGHMRATFHFVSRKPTQEYLLTLSPLHAHNLKNHSAARIDVPQSRSKSLLLCSLQTALGVNGCPCQRCITCACLKNDPPTGLFPLANGFDHSPGLKFSTCPFRKLLVIWGCNYVFGNMSFFGRNAAHNASATKTRKRRTKPIDVSLCDVHPSFLKYSTQHWLAWQLQRFRIRS